MTGHNIMDGARIDLWPIDGTNYTLAAGTDGAVVTTGTEIDMAGYNSVMVIVCLGTIAASGVFTGTLKNSDTSGTYGSGTVDRIATLANDADTDDNKLLIVEVYRPQRRYLRLNYQRTGGNVTVLSMLVVRFNSGNEPVSQGTSAGGVESLQVLNNPTPSAT
jgi:hypothetical protein